MNIKKTSSAISLAVLSLCGASAAMAQDANWYGGASVGRSAATIDDARITTGLAAQGLATTSIDDRDRGTGYKLFGGYQLNRNFAVEAGFFDLGKFGYTANTSPAGTLRGDIRVKGVNLDLVGMWPVTDKLSLLARVGATSARTTGQFAATGVVVNPYGSTSTRSRSTNLKVGAGINYDITESLGLRLEAERYRIGDSVGNKGHIDLYSLGMIYRFGAKPQPVRAEVQPMVVAAAPAPAPVIAPPPPPPPAPAPAPAPMRVSLSADALFDFDQSALKPSGRNALDKLASDLRGMNYDAIQVTGHTDRLGGHAYNLKLSARRADAVSAYLVQSGGVASGKISAKGVDGDNPVTKPGDCKGNKPTPTLIACLQPDRRVDVEVTGTR